MNHQLILIALALFCVGFLFATDYRMDREQTARELAYCMSKGASESLCKIKN